MREISFPLSARELSKAIQGALIGNPEVLIERLSALPEAKSGSLTFLSDLRFRSQLSLLESGVTVITNPQLAKGVTSATCLVVSEPRKIFAEVAKRVVPESPWKGISSQAIIHPSARIEDNVVIGPQTVVCENVVIKKGTVIYPSVYIGPNIEIGESCEIHPFVSLLCRTRIGNNVKILSGTVIGSEGFGYLESNDQFSEFPQVGGVIIEDEVRIGAKCTIDRSTLGDTLIGRGTKIDNQVHIGHNCRIGRNNILCAQVGLAGSTTLKDGVILGGQVGVGGHLTIHEKAVCGGQTGVTRDLPGNQKYFSTPALPLTEAFRNVMHLKRIPEMIRRLKKLEENQKK